MRHKLPRRAISAIPLVDKLLTSPPRPPGTFCSYIVSAVCAPSHYVVVFHQMSGLLLAVTPQTEIWTLRSQHRSASNVAVDIDKGLVPLGLYRFKGAPQRRLDTASLARGERPRTFFRLRYRWRHNVSRASSAGTT